MSKNNLKKIMLFTSETTRNIIETIIQDESMIEGRTQSSIIEQHLLNELLPQNNNAKFWLEQLYSGEWELQRVLNAIFDMLSGGINWEARYTNGLPLVQYAYKWHCIKKKPNFDFTSKEIHHFKSQFDSVVQRLMLHAEKTTKIEDQKEAEWAHSLYTKFEKEPNEFEVSHLYQLLLSNWDIFENWTITYRLLSDMVIMEKEWINNEESRYELKQLLTKLSKEWN